MEPDWKAAPLEAMAYALSDMIRWAVDLNHQRLAASLALARAEALAIDNVVAPSIVPGKQQQATLAKEPA